MKRLNKSVQFRHTRSKCTFNKEHTVRTHTHTHTHTGSRRSTIPEMITKPSACKHRFDIKSVATLHENTANFLRNYSH